MSSALGRQGLNLESNVLLFNLVMYCNGRWWTQRRAGLQMSESATSPVGSVDHLSPPSTSSRLSDSEPDPSDLGDGEEGGSGVGGGGGGSSSGGMGVSGGPLLPPSRHTRGALERSVRSDGASVSSMGSSSRYVLDIFPLLFFLPSSAFRRGRHPISLSLSR